MTSELIAKAARYAALAHASAVQSDGTIGQLRKRTNEPYIVHPTAVAKTVRMAGGSEEMIAAAYLHDVIEDCGKTEAELNELFGKVVTGYVVWLTDCAPKTLPNRVARRAFEHERFKGAPPEVQTIKLADSNDNTADIVENDPKFAKVYMREKAHDMVLLKEGDPALYKIAVHKLCDYFNHIDYDQSMLDFINENL